MIWQKTGREQKTQARGLGENRWKLSLDNGFSVRRTGWCGDCVCLVTRWGWRAGSSLLLHQEQEINIIDRTGGVKYTLRRIFYVQQRGEPGGVSTLAIHPSMKGGHNGQNEPLGS